jgi:hypothetical protein
MYIHVNEGGQLFGSVSGFLPQPVLVLAEANEKEYDTRRELATGGISLPAISFSHPSKVQLANHNVLSSST